MNVFHYFLTIVMLVSQSNWESDLNTGKNSAYMSQTEIEILFEMNKARSNPARYAEEYLVNLRSFFDGNKFIRPGRPTIITAEGRKALEECIRIMKNKRPAYPLYPERGLYLAALDQVKDQRENGGIGHYGSDGSKPINRIERYGDWDICAAENVSYGIDDAQMIVISLLIDDGIPDRAHRDNILNPGFTVAGVSFGSHPSYGSTCVMDFAGAYKSK